MRLKILGTCVLSLMLGGCLVTSHEHFNSAEGESIPLPHGRYQCDLVGEYVDLIKEEIMVHAHEVSGAFFEPFEGRMVLIEREGGRQYEIFKGPHRSYVYAFQKYDGSTYVVSKPLPSSKGHVNMFFRIEGLTLTLLAHSKPDVLFKRAADYDLILTRELNIPVVFGEKRLERAFLDLTMLNRYLVPVSVCKFLG